MATALRFHPDRVLGDAALAARLARTRHVSVPEPGIRRVRHGKNFVYVAPNGRRIREPAELARIRSLVIPPAWENVWICTSADGHVQATGRDARGRKQYRYHPDWRQVRETAKYERMLTFGAALPRLRARVRHDLAQRGLPKTRVLAAMVSLLQRTSIRVGNDEYAAQNGSYGLTTLRDQHAQIRGSVVELCFRGKAGKAHRVRVQDADLARIVRRSRDLHGARLFQYLDDEGRRHSITSSHVNRYLREAMGNAFTAKEFRTWAGTVLATVELALCDHCRCSKAAKKTLRRVIEAVAGKLGNTVAVCRKSYVHPIVVDAYLAGTLKARFTSELARARRHPRAGLRPEESAVLACLELLARRRREPQRLSA